MQENPTEPDQSKPKAKPPYLFLVPVAVGLVGFIGYQTIRMGTAPQDPQQHYQYAIDTTTAAPISAGTIVVHASAVRQAQRVAQAARAPRPAASPTPQPTATPTAGASATPTPQSTPHAPVKVVVAKPVHHNGRHRSAQQIASQTIPRFDRPIAARAVSNVGSREAVPEQNASETATTPPITDAPSVRKEPAQAQPVQVAEVQRQAPAAAPAPVNAGDRVVDARMTYAASPDYPEIARDQGVRGTSTVFVTVDPNGSIVHVSIASSSGNAILDRSAVTAARTSRYVRPTVDGKPATATYRVTYDFAP